MKKEQVVGTTIVRITCSVHLAPPVGLEPTTGQKPWVALLTTARIAPGFFRTRSRFIRHRRCSGSFQLKPLRGC